VVIRLVLADIQATRPLRNVQLTHPPYLSQGVQVVTELVSRNSDWTAVWLGEAKAIKYRLKTMLASRSECCIDLVDVDRLNDTAKCTFCRVQLITPHYNERLRKLKIHLRV